MLWILGDNSIEELAMQFAREGEEVLVSARPGATPEQVWTEQIHDSLSRGWSAPGAKPITVIVFLPQRDYDSELTAWHVLRKAPKGSRVIYMVLPDSPKVIEGLTHYDVPELNVVEMQAETVMEKLRELI